MLIFIWKGNTRLWWNPAQTPQRHKGHGWNELCYVSHLALRLLNKTGVFSASDSERGSENCWSRCLRPLQSGTTGKWFCNHEENEFLYFGYIASTITSHTSIFYAIVWWEKCCAYLICAESRRSSWIIIFLPTRKHLCLLCSLNWARGMLQSISLLCVPVYITILVWRASQMPEPQSLFPASVELICQLLGQTRSIN